MTAQPVETTAAPRLRDVPMRELGAFLHRKRAAIRPEQVGIPAPLRGKRRTPGLRREEVALAAGVGVSWYTWIEQGRAENVSAEILDSLARTLRLTTNERLYIRRLADGGGKVPEPEAPVPASALRAYPDNWSAGPAYVVDHRWDVRAANDAARTVLGFTVGVNVLRAIFTDPVALAGFADAAAAQRDHVARFRSHMSHYPGDAGLWDLVSALGRESVGFRRLWQEHEVAEDSCGRTELVLPEGRTAMSWTAFSFTERIGLTFVTFHPPRA